MFRFVKIDLIYYGRIFILVICKHSYMVSPCYKLKNFIVYSTPKVFQLLLRKGAFCGFRQLIAYKFPIEQKVLTQFDECGASVETVVLLENSSAESGV